MSEMLANYHFIVRNYCRAVSQLEQELINQPANKLIKKKLIICYTQTNKLQKALKLFIQLIQEDINIIIDTEQEFEACPCPDLIAPLENETVIRNSNLELFLELGILWLYCDFDESYRYFLRAQQLDTNNKNISKIIDLLQLTKWSNNGKTK